MFFHHMYCLASCFILTTPQFVSKERKLLEIVKIFLRLKNGFIAGRSDESLSFLTDLTPLQKFTLQPLTANAEIMMS